MEALVNITRAAELLGLTVPTVRKYTMLHLVPFRKDGRRCVYSPSELEAWSNARRVPALDEQSKGLRRRGRPVRVERVESVSPVKAAS